MDRGRKHATDEEALRYAAAFVFCAENHDAPNDAKRPAFEAFVKGVIAKNMHKAHSPALT